MTNCKKQDVYVGVIADDDDLAFRLRGKAGWDIVEVYNDELRKAPIGTSWSVTSWDAIETAEVIGKHIDGVSCRVKIRFVSESVFGYSTTETTWTYDV